MDDPEEKPSLADDTGFLASLDGLDRGLELEAWPANQRTHRPRAARPVSPAPSPAAPDAPAAPTAPSVPPPAGIASPSGAPPASAVAPVPAGRRPLLDLFPPSRVGNAGPPEPLAGTAVGPSLPAEAPRRPAAPPLAPPAPPDSYEAFYGLREKPFGVSTDPKFFFPSVEHERVEVELLTAIRERQPVTLVTGEHGIGKTAVCRAVLQQLDRRTMSSLVAEPAASIDDLLKTVLVDFGVVSRDDVARGRQFARDSLAATLGSFLDSLAPLQATAVVVVDDAERQPAEVLAALSRFADGTSASLQIVLVGTRALAARLKEAPALRAFDAAVTVRLDVGPLAGDEIGGYVRHRIAAAGASPRVHFDEAAVTRLFELSRGVPAVVNLLCDRALARGFERSAATIDGALIRAAADALLPSDAEASSTVRTAIVGGLLVVLALAGGAAALWVFRDAAARTVIQWENVPAPPGGPVRLKPVPLQAVPPPPDGLDEPR